MAKLSAELKDLYVADYIKTWREYLNKSVVARYGSLSDAAQKLLKHSGNRAPLLALFCEASFNTGVDSPEVQQAFQPVQQVVPPACENKYVQDPNRPYVTALLGLQSCLETTANSIQNAPADQRAAALHALARGVDLRVQGVELRAQALLDFLPAEAHAIHCG